MERLDSKTLALDIAVNLDRVARFMQAGRTERVDQFLAEVKNYTSILQNRELHAKFAQVFADFLKFLTHSQDSERDKIDSYYFFSTLLQNRAAYL